MPSSGIPPTGVDEGTSPPDIHPDLFLLQISDSAFPIGTFSHSWGLETAIQADRVSSAAELEHYLQGLLAQSIAPMDGVACCLAHQYQAATTEANFITLQTVLTASRWAAEPLKASIDLGKRLNRIVTATWGVSCPQTEPLHHCTAFGWLCSRVGVELESTVRAYMLGAMTSLVSAAVRSIPLGHSQGQYVLASLHTELERAIAQCIEQARSNPSPAQLASFAPLQERDCQAHQQLYMRLFQS